MKILTVLTPIKTDTTPYDISHLSSEVVVVPSTNNKLVMDSNPAIQEKNRTRIQTNINSGGNQYQHR